MTLDPPIIVWYGVLSCLAVLGARAELTQHLEHLDEWHFRYTLENHGDACVSVLTRDTPLMDLESPIFFRVFATTNELMHALVPYSGIKCKLKMPGADEYFWLCPGESRTGLVDLSRSHRLFPNTTYDIELATHPEYVSLPMPATLHRKHRQARLSFRVSQPSPDPHDPRPRKLRLHRAKSHGFHTGNCSPQQIAELHDTVARASEVVESRHHYFFNESCRDIQYTRYFGNDLAGSFYDEVRDTVLRVFKTLQSGEFTLYCGGSRCASNMYAYVVVRAERGVIVDDRTIYLCPLFWPSASKALGWDSRPGTLIHELTHHFYIGATLDFVYGRNAAASLALRDPGKAINNADSYEVFHEQGTAECGKWTLADIPSSAAARAPPLALVLLLIVLNKAATRE